MRVNKQIGLSAWGQAETLVGAVVPDRPDSGRHRGLPLQEDKPKDLKIPWQQQVKTLPDKPGVYLFKAENGRVIYVGKAACLSKRVPTYTRPVSDPKTRAMLAAARELEYIVTDSELEALMLENVLIKKEQPRYNVILRDDKNYPYLQLNPAEAFPRLRVVRRIAKKREGLYYGPYVPSKALRSTLKLLGRVFPLRQCPRLDFKRQRPCLNYQMKRCLAPCQGLVSEKDYQEIVQQVRYFLEGKSRQLQGLIRRRMQAAARQLQYERAARLRDNLLALERVSEQQKIISTHPWDGDVIGLARACCPTVGAPSRRELSRQDAAPTNTKPEKSPLGNNPATSSQVSCFAVLFIRQGMVIGHKSLLMEGEQETNPAELLAAFMQQLYAPGGPQIPPRILLPQASAQQALLQEWLAQLGGRRVQLLVPKRGKKRRLVELAGENARSALQQHQAQEERSLALISQAQQELGLKTLPRRIEGFDISNIQGQQAVGSMVVWRQPGFLKAAYRQFKIKTVSGIDDCAMLAEVLKRRYQRLPLEDKADLILVDGGKGQVNAARRVLDELGLTIPVLGLAKREEEIYFPHNSTPLKLPASSATLGLLQRIRDEAHRFALKHHRQRRSKAALHSGLEEIPGIGPQRRRALLAHFGALEGVKQAPLEELEELPFLSARVAQALHAHYHLTSSPPGGED